tara:strand:- start:4238 stop:5512 length:1275 start_codon:yes stop_codon:yes gene_type:complete
VAKKITNILNFLILIFPICFISGPALTNINIFLINILFLYFLYLEKNLSLLLKYKIFFFIYLYVVCSSLLSNNIFFSLKSSLFFFRYIILIVCITYLVEKKFLKLTKLFNILILIILIFFIDLVFEFYNNKNILGFSNNDPERLSSFFDQELISGSFLSKIMLLIIPIIICCDNKAKFYPFILLGMFSVFITGERTAFYTLLIYIFLIIFFIKSEKIKVFKILSITIFLITIFSLLNPNLSYRMSEKILVQSNVKSIIAPNKTDNKNSKTSQKRIYYISIDHEAHLLAAYKIFKLKPLFGAGPNQYRNYTCSKKYTYFNDERQNRVCTTHPHNHFVQILSELGLVGFALLFFIIIKYLVYIFINLKKLSKNVKEYNLFLTKNFSVLIFLIPFLPNGNFFGSWGGSLLFYIIGLLLSNYNIKSFK